MARKKRSRSTAAAHKATFTKPELAEVLGVTKDAVDGWCKKGIPRKKRGRACVFSRKAIIEWFASHTSKQMHKHVYTLAETAPAKSKPKKKPEGVAAMEDALTRAREVERQTFDAISAEKGVMQQMAQEHHIKASDNLRKLEKDWAAIQLSMNEVIRRDKHKEILVDMAGLIRNALLAMPARIAPDLAGLEAVEVHKLLTAEIHEVLRHLSEGK